MNNFKFNLLIDELPSTVVVDGSSFSINTDFRYGLLFNQCIEDQSVSSRNKFEQALKIGYKDEIPDNSIDAFYELIKFYSCAELDGKDIDNELNNDEEDAEEEEVDDGTDMPNKVFDYEYDAVLIYNTFMKIYKIDLAEVEMHWYKFMTLLRGLFDENDLTKVLQYRVMKIDSKMSPELKRHYTKLRQHYSLNNSRTKSEKESIKKKMMEEWG